MKVSTPNIEFLITSDGSHSLRNTEIDETYHSSHGAIQESQHIFMEFGWRQRQHSILESDTLQILEIGFGTGLNALLCQVEAEKQKQKTIFTTIELYPLMYEQYSKLNFPQQLKISNDAFYQLHQADWEQKVKISPYFSIYKKRADFATYIPEDNYDLIIFDAFSPEKQPELWSEERFKVIYAHCLPGAVLTTYCAKGMVRRAMQAAGFRVERLPGPPGKRQILRATKITGEF